MSHTRVLIVHPDPSVGAMLTSMLQTLGHKIDEAPNDRAAVRMLEHAPVGLVLAGTDPDDSDALEFLCYLRRKYTQVPVILLFSTPRPDRAREAQVRGAAAVLRLPLPANELRAAVAQALGEPEVGSVRASADVHVTPASRGRLADGPPQPRESRFGRLTFDAAVPYPTAPRSSQQAGAGMVIGDDPSLRQAIELAGTIAPSGAPILIQGERGVGKSLLARSIHARGSHPDAPFVEVSCRSMKESVLEAELFGRRAEDFTQADRAGKVALARGGTLYLDEVSALSPSLQFKLLRLLRDGEYEAVGSSRAERAEVRVILGTREDPAAMAADGRFRQDLYYRISVVTLKLPPLRHRGSDVERLAEHFLARFTRQLAKDIRGFAPEALEVLRSHGWPGNVQELEQAVERAVVVCRGTRIEANHLALSPREIAPVRPASRSHRATLAANILPLKEAMEGPEKELILQALEFLNWNRQETARVLDINRTTLYKKMKKYGLLIDEPAWVN